MNIEQEVAALKEELIGLRRDFHRHPELGYEEFRTSKIIYDYLKECEIEPQIVAKTGVVGLLKGKESGKTIMLRADIDALAQTEQNDVPYQSLNQGKMHACGHDGHTAILLVTAKILSRYRDKIKGNIKFVFQPNEETAGALDMINEGVLENPKVDAALGLHLWTPVESGKFGLVTGPTMAANEEFELSIFGKAGHTSAPQTALDPIMVATTIIQSLQTIQTREVNVLTPTLIMIGKIHSGTARNIIPDKVEMGGTIRFLYENESAEKELLKRKFERLIKGICEALGAEYKLEYIPSNPSVMNNPQLVDLVRNAIKETVGNDLSIVPYLCMAGDDFAEFTQRVPSVYYFIGNGNKAKNTNFPHHHPKFNLDEETLPVAVEIQVRAALEFLKQ